MGENKFFEKLAYLYKTSVEIIQEYGFLYFLRFGSGQLKQQKLDILKPKDDYEKLLIKKSLDKKNTVQNLEGTTRKTIYIYPIIHT